MVMINSHEYQRQIDRTALGETAKEKFERMHQSPTEPTQPLLGEVLDRLRRVRSRLADAGERIEAVADRVLGPVPATPSASGGTASSSPTIADELLDQIGAITKQVERLHEVASRVERIG